MSPPVKKNTEDGTGPVFTGSCILPPPLFSGDCIGVIAPAGAADPEALEAGLEEIRSRGYALKVADQVYMKEPLGFAGSDLIRAGALMDFFEDPDVHAIWMARGGYGCTRLFPLLNAEIIAAFPKRVMGFSDGTALLLFLMEQCGMAGLHGPVLTQLGRLPSMDRDAAFDALVWEGGQPMFVGWKKVLQPGRAVGRLMGGNLSMICHLLGTPWCPDFTGSILFLEDVNEAPYRIDRMFCHLAMAGVLKEVSGLLLGDFTHCGNEAQIYERILAFLPEGIPVVCGLPLGHGDRNQPLMLGARACLDTGTAHLIWEWHHGFS
ncbi:muramoyltetrapeptide carboxypeptidase [Desulfobotulus alkaliphilus]|uniref:Muramoyltetrapeptide carboxypeptidase n=1 Tax=Desulfobotulus alkaliphilus TaxID=622671 RepID=A0A562RGL2_9BACT|nr:LD-carboxypeptidase [Desulfobotulus alkaliphilus]TWI68211.1 muramoyltetrapeptide carboxypeptidase [Desulfobotulus alkaliphilus]